MTDKKLSTEEKMNKTLEFFKAAFCVDGEVKINFDVGNYRLGDSVIELNDSERGRFFIAIVDRI